MEGDSNEMRMNARLWGDWEWNDDDKKLFHLSRHHCSRRSSNSTMTKLSLPLSSSLSYCMVSSGPIFGGGKMNVNYVKEQHKSTSHWKSREKVAASSSFCVLLSQKRTSSAFVCIYEHDREWFKKNFVLFTLAPKHSWISLSFGDILCSCWCECKVSHEFQIRFLSISRQAPAAVAVWRDKKIYNADIFSPHTRKAKLRERDVDKCSKSVRWPPKKLRKCGEGKLCMHNYIVSRHSCMILCARKQLRNYLCELPRVWLKNSISKWPPTTSPGKRNRVIYGERSWNAQFYPPSSSPSPMLLHDYEWSRIKNQHI